MSNSFLLRNPEPLDNSEVKHNSILPIPLMMVICGKTGSGKTRLLLKMMLTDNFLDYNNVIVFTPTKEQKDYLLLQYGFEYKLLKSDMIAITGILHKYRDEQIEEICKFYSQNKEGSAEQIQISFYDQIHNIPPPTTLNKYKKNLIIFDDCVELKNQTIIESYFTKGRHANCSCIYLAQNFYGIPKGNIRTQLSAIILFKLGDSDKKFSYEHVSSFMDRRDYYQLLNIIWKKQFSYVYINKQTEEITDNIFSEL